MYVSVLGFSDRFRLSVAFFFPFQSPLAFLFHVGLEYILHYLVVLRRSNSIALVTSERILVPKLFDDSISFVSQRSRDSSIAVEDPRESRECSLRAIAQNERIVLTAKVHSKCIYQVSPVPKFPLPDLENSMGDVSRLCQSST